jgi:hypothetical protein
MWRSCLSYHGQEIEKNLQLRCAMLGKASSIHFRNMHFLCSVNRAETQIVKFCFDKDLLLMMRMAWTLVVAMYRILTFSTWPDRRNKHSWQVNIVHPFVNKIGLVHQNVISGPVMSRKAPMFCSNPWQIVENSGKRVDVEMKWILSKSYRAARKSNSEFPSR